MSDSIEKTIESINQSKTPFNAILHAKKICEGGKIQFCELGEIDYEKGWQELVEELLNTLISKPIIITSMTSEYGQLDITFKILKRTAEATIWKEINYAKIRSRDVCMTCGHFGQRSILNNKVIVICRKCIANVENNGATGTWLDKF